VETLPRWLTGRGESHFVRLRRFLTGAASLSTFHNPDKRSIDRAIQFRDLVVPRAGR
jgi:hypothetical protein